MRGSGAPCSVALNTGVVSDNLVFCFECGKEGDPLILNRKRKEDTEKYREVFELQKLKNT